MGSIADPGHPFMNYGGSNETLPDPGVFVVKAVLHALLIGDAFKEVLGIVIRETSKKNVQ